ncbi:MAG: N-6 DNA methylase [Flavobacteriales bacterium]|nr:N-6 DNA methylase [Flavobacteriales bacterium]
MTLPEYLTALAKLHASGRATEHSYRGDLQRLLSALCPGVAVTNEPQRIACGAPDYILTRKDIPVGYIEAKDIGVDLGSKSLKEQFDRYRGSLDNLIITDYLEFCFFRNGEPTTSIRIGEVSNGKVKPLPAEFDKFTALIADFAAWQGQTITSAKKLASMMAGKARLLADVIEQAVSSDEASQANTDLRQQLDAFKVILIHDITPKAFADLYAQTIAYGMFAARLHDPSPDSFSREEAAKLIPKSNPFLRKLFNSISGNDLDTRIEWIVDALADIFRATDIAKLLGGFGKGSGREDAFMHFYEDFLAQYDPKLRKSRGVWYTPDAVVRFIVRAVDEILKSEFGLVAGLADASKVKIKRKVVTQGRHGNAKVKEVAIEEEVHRVQVLDPATGTGTFLAEVVRQVYAKFEGQQGLWPAYVEQHLIPRLNGFELLMASYAMAHLKLDLVLRDTGYDMGQPHGTPNANARGGVVRPSGAEAQQRLRVFLTNSLEEAHPDTGTLFASWLSQEANEANAVKRDTPVMVVLGNPPYSGISTNKGEWISSLIEDYKYVDGQHFGEKKHWLGDDYVKFIRFGEHFIEKTGEGVLAYINNHSFLDNPTFRGMRWHLLNTFDKIYVIDLHGNSKKKEVAPDGSKDENVFDIQQGVSINLFVRTAQKKKGQLGKVFHADLWGARELKYDTLKDERLTNVSFAEANYSDPAYFFQPVDDGASKQYQKGFSVQDIFTNSTVGFVTGKDGITIDFDKAVVRANMLFLKENDDAAIRSRFGLKAKDARDWAVPTAKRDVIANFSDEKLVPCAYRPFDTRMTFYSGNSRGIYASPQRKIMRHFIDGKNLGIVIGRQGQVVGAMEWNLVYCTDQLTDFNMFYRGGVMASPLYLYPETTKQTRAVAQAVQPNLDAKLVEQLAKGVGLTYTFKPEAPALPADRLFAHGTAKELTPLDVLDFCYAVLHSPAYRAKYKEFLKSDFPRIPFPTDAKKFRALVQLGAQLRQLHLLEWEGIDRYITQYPVGGSNEVTRKMSAKSPGFEATGKGLGKVWINDTQYFAGVPEVAWNFYIGGYQPAQKWLKDRHGRTLTFDDIRHYQRMIVALTETGKVMEEVDTVGVV